MNEIPANEATDPSEKALVDGVMRRWDRAKAERSTWLALWNEMAKYVRPSVDPVLRSVTNNYTPKLTGFEQLFDSTAIQANLVLASGTMARLTPAQTPWFRFDPPQHLRQSDAAKLWYHECTEIAIEALAVSNFYTELHNLYLDRGAFGSGCFHCDSGHDVPLWFKTNDLGTFSYMNGADGRVDTVFREMRFDAREAAQEYGEESLPESLQKELKETSSNFTHKHDFVHCILPRTDINQAKMDAKNMPIASIHIHVKTRQIVRNSGYAEMPTFGSRYLRWGDASYGFCPAWQALPDMRQNNDVNRFVDVLAEIAAFPRILAPHDFDGEIDLRSSGVTPFKSVQDVPREWATSGKYDIAEARIRYREQKINQAFHVELFQQWQATTREMTAAEVNARELEKIELFSPTFTLLTTELYGPLLRRVFSLLLRQGCFSPPPQEALYQNHRGRWSIPDPKIEYTSRLALALHSVRSYALDKAVARIAQMSGFNPQVGDNLNWDKAFRDATMDDGLPADWMPDEDSVAKARDSRAQQQAQQVQIGQAHQLADSASKLAQSGLIPQLPKQAQQ
jgi:hypothetical protein